MVEKLVAKGEDVGIVAKTRFIARTGGELKTYLDNLKDLPKGVSYEGSMFRSIGKSYNNPIDIHPGAINAEYRYSREGVSGLYLSETKAGNITEISHYGDISGYKTYQYDNTKIDNILDLTDDVVRQKLGVDFDLITKTDPLKSKSYEFTYELGDWAIGKGYKGLIVPGARGAKDYKNIVIFTQMDVNNALQSITPKIINH